MYPDTSLKIRSQFLSLAKQWVLNNNKFFFYVSRYIVPVLISYHIQLNMLTLADQFTHAVRLISFFLHQATLQVLSLYLEILSIPVVHWYFIHINQANSQIHSSNKSRDAPPTSLFVGQYVGRSKRVLT